MKTWLLELLNEPSFLGSLIGALLTGIVAIYVLRRGIRHQNDLLEKTELGNFIKEAMYLSNSMSSLINSIKQYVQVQYEEETIVVKEDSEGFPTDEFAEVKFAKEIYQKDIEDSLIGIRSVDRKAFTYDSFETYIKIINNCEGQIEYFWKRSMKNHIGGVAEILEENNTKLMVLKSDLDKHIENEKMRYEKLK